MIISPETNTVIQSYGCVKQMLTGYTKEEMQVIIDQTYYAKNVWNQSLYLIKQGDIEPFLLADATDLIDSYKMLNSNVAQRVINKVIDAWKSYYELLQKSLLGEYDKPVHEPYYLAHDDHYILTIEMLAGLRNQDGTNKEKFPIPCNREYKKEHPTVYLKIPPELHDKYIVRIEIIPIQHGLYYEAHYTYRKITAPNQELDYSKAMAIDLGVNNFVTCGTTDFKAFIIDGKGAKSCNAYANKQNAKLRSELAKEGNVESRPLWQSMRLGKIWTDRNLYIDNFMHQAVAWLVNYALKKHIGNAVIGYNPGWKDKVEMGSVNNQNFCSLPFGRFKDLLISQCCLNGILCITQEESYTSKASFLDNDPIPVYGEKRTAPVKFSGTREERGRYVSADGRSWNADVNALYNILAKSGILPDVVEGLRNRGYLPTPLRIKL